MDGYLVMLRHHEDDLPLLLTGDIREAMQFAKRVTEEDGGNEKAILKLDSSTPVSVQLYEFSSGRLARVTAIKSFVD